MVRVLTIVAGRHVEIELQHIGTLVVLRKHGRYFSVGVRTPKRIATSFSGALDIQLCTTRCPIAERLSLSHVSGSVGRATEFCRRQGLVDFFLDACVFDFLATDGDQNFSQSAVHAMRDYRRLGATKLPNRTTVLPSDAGRLTPTDRLTLLLCYLMFAAFARTLFPRRDGKVS